MAERPDVSVGAIVATVSYGDFDGPFVDYFTVTRHTKTRVFIKDRFGRESWYHLDGLSGPGDRFNKLRSPSDPEIQQYFAKQMDRQTFGQIGTTLEGRRRTNARDRDDEASAKDILEALVGFYDRRGLTLALYPTNELQRLQEANREHRETLANGDQKLADAQMKLANAEREIRRLRDW